MGLIFISHDLSLVGSFCDRVIVMYAGKAVETLPARDLANARHDYEGLLRCVRACAPTPCFHPQARAAWLA